MTRFKSDKLDIQKSIEEVFQFISDLNNLKEIMPDPVRNLKTTTRTCAFSVEGIPPIKLKIIKLDPFKLIELINEDEKINFKLFFNLIKTQNSCTVQIFFESQLNMMMELMLKKPLINFLNILVKKLSEIK